MSRQGGSWVSIGVFAAAVLGCASSWSDAPLETAGADEPIVVTLQARDAEIAIRSTPRGVRYSARDAHGNLHATLTLEQLRELDPQLYELVRSATAGASLGDSGAPFLDASLGLVPAVRTPFVDARRGSPR